MKPMISLVFCALLLTTSMLSATVPQQIAYQGKLFSDSDFPLTGSYFIGFDFYNTRVGGASIHTLVPQLVTVNQGLFETNLNVGGSPIDWSVDSLFLEVNVRHPDSAAAVTLSPRSVLTSSPYAFVSEFADSTIHWIHSSANSAKRRGGIIIDSGPGVTVADNGADSIRVSFNINAVPCSLANANQPYPMANTFDGADVAGFGATTVMHTVPSGKTLYFYGLDFTTEGGGSRGYVEIATPPGTFHKIAYTGTLSYGSWHTQMSFNPPIRLSEGSVIQLHSIDSNPWSCTFWGWEGTP